MLCQGSQRRQLAGWWASWPAGQLELESVVICSRRPERLAPLSVRRCCACHRCVLTCPRCPCTTFTLRTMLTCLGCCRDVKPDNVVIEGGRTGGRVFLVDFGGVQVGGR